MTYKEAIIQDMKWLGRRKDVVVLGQGITVGDRMYHTLDTIPIKKCIEQPIAENLTMGMGIGLAMTGFRPLVVFQRMDFMLIAADQIINHLALIPSMSNGQYQLPVIIRACIGSRDTKFVTGPQHNHNFRHVFNRYITTVNYHPGAYREAYGRMTPTLIVEEKDEYVGTI